MTPGSAADRMRGPLGHCLRCSGPTEGDVDLCRRCATQSPDRLVLLMREAAAVAQDEHQFNIADYLRTAADAREARLASPDAASSQRSPSRGPESST